MTLTDILSRLEGVKGRDGKYMARCPNHGDSNPSLSVSLGSDNKILLKCFAGCPTEDIVGAMGLTMKDLFADIKPNEAFPAYGEAKAYQPATQESEYLYAGGQLKKQKFRKADGSKYCVWKHLNGSTWEKGRNNIRPGLYQSQTVLPEIFFLVEGEKDVENLKNAGMVAVSLPDGAQSKWEGSYNAVFKGKQVVILPDNDEPGKKYAQMCAEKLHGVAAMVWVLDLKNAWPEIPDKGDISDMIARFGAEAALGKVMKVLKSTPQWEPGQAATEALSLICAADVEYSLPKWLISPYFQRGKGTLIQADPGTGKTAFMCAIAASVTTGRPIMGLAVETPGSVLMLSVEDDLGVLRGRIGANGGDPNKVYFMKNAAEMTINSPEIEQAVKQVEAKLLIFDPLQAFLGANIDMFRANETRPALAKLFEMCDRNDCACAIISHTGKNGLGKSPVNQSLGSVDIPAAMRSVLHIARNPEDDTECIAVHVKSSNAPKGRSIAYGIVDRGGVEWHGFCDFSVEDLNAAQKRTERGVPYENEPLVQVFNQLITDKPGGGFWSYEEVKNQGSKILGFPPFYSTQDLKKKLDSSFCRELQEKDGLIVTCGHKQKGIRGIRIEQYRPPDGYQTKIQE